MTIEEITQSIEERGYCEGVSSSPVIVPETAAPDNEKFLVMGGAHRRLHIPMPAKPRISMSHCQWGWRHTKSGAAHLPHKLLQRQLLARLLFCPSPTRHA